jgi:glutamine---fructose-6-phosphate transaminase (isomerizing)
VRPLLNGSKSGKLQIKEIALIHGEGVHAGELKHGALALVDPQLPCIVLATQDSMYSKMINVIQQLKARFARLIVICTEGDTQVPALLNVDQQKKACTVDLSHPGEVLCVPATEESLQPVINVIPLQLLSYHLTVLRGLNVDQPRNLAKSVTVTED